MSPNISLVPCAIPDGSTARSVEVYIESANVCTVHVIPEIQALASGGSRSPLAIQPCFVTSTSWKRCFDVQEITLRCEE